MDIVSVDDTQTKKNPTTFCYGDSHAILFVYMKGIVEHWLGMSNLPVTMYRFGKEGLDLIAAPKILGNGHENHCPKENDIVLYSYGEIDLRHNWNKLVEKNSFEKKLTDDTFIENLVHPYLEKILENEKRFGVKSVVLSVLSPLHPGDIADMTFKMNNLLRSQCQVKKIHFFDLYSALVGPDKSILDKSLHQPDGVHLKKECASMVLQLLTNFLEKEMLWK